ncbi:endonuclease/exonuclease/phosphatase family protein [bacterium SCSIO 12643]|nr:endonuclease/exonuclease/phosphatase family protein [bacterium SCSIO 12643]
MKKLSWFQKLIFIVNLGASLGLIVASFSSSFEPQQSALFYLAGLTYPFFLLINILFILYWVYQRKLVFILPLIACIIGSSNFKSLIAFNSKPKQETSTFKIMSFNVRLFNKYKWIEKDHLDDKIIEYIKSESPDIIAFQEFINITKEDLNYIKEIKNLGYKYYIFEPRNRGYTKHNFFGLITFSKHKITDNGVAYQNPESSRKTISLYTDINIQGKTIRIYNTHFNSLRFISEDYEFVENIADNDEEEAIKKSKNILNKVMNSARKRQNEVTFVRNHMMESPHPIIMLGDFNEPPYSYAYPQFTDFLEDPFLQYGFGLGTTYDGISTIPGLRLDYILHSKELKSTGFYTGPSGLSDHRPIISNFLIEE